MRINPGKLKFSGPLLRSKILVFLLKKVVKRYLPWSVPRQPPRWSDPFTVIVDSKLKDFQTGGSKY